MSIQAPDPQWDHIRTVHVREELWFVLKDLCDELGIEDIDQVAKRLDKNGVQLADTTDALGRTRNVRVINRPNLVSFLARSNKPEAFTLLDQLYQQVINAVQPLDSQGLLEENVQLRKQLTVQIDLTAKALELQDVPHTYDLDETADFEALIGGVRKLMKEIQTVLKAKKIEADQLLELVKKLEKKMAILEEKAAASDEKMLEILQQVGKQHKLLSEFRQEALAFIPPALQIEGPKGGLN